MNSGGEQPNTPSSGGSTTPGTSSGTSSSSSTTELVGFHRGVEKFSDEVGALLRDVFDPGQLVEVDHKDGIPRSVIKAEVPLYASGTVRAGTPLAALTVRIWLCLDSSAKHLAVDESQYKLISTLDREPIIRFEYDRGVSGKPGAHIQVHAHRGALSHLLTKTGYSNPHAMESLHLPTGGDRFRISLEDVVEFRVVECKFDKRDGWRDQVSVGRKRWRRMQLLSAVRDAPSIAVDALEALGYSVTLPGTGAAPDAHDKLTRW